MQVEAGDYLSILKRYWGYEGFRGVQQEIIESIGAGHDTLGLMPTGGGKSITFQVPALAQEGVCIVITPLIALMKDQVQNLRRRGIRAAAIYTGLTHDEVLTTLENAVFGAVKLLYVSPERLGSELFRKKLLHMKVSFVCVDEAHCISQWGYDFRPAYLEIADIRRQLSQVPVLALTATATPQVVADIQDKLRRPKPISGNGEDEAFKVFQMSFERKNLAYVVRYAPDKNQQLVHILNHVGGSAIVYARSRRRTKEFAELLTKAGISSTFYHAGLDNATKDQRQQLWQQGQVRVMVATNAFGMGIDKADVRLVLHTDCPSSPEAYFQEAGRAGRDGKKSYAVLLYNNGDHQKLLKRISDAFPEKEYIRDVYEHLAFFFQVGVGSGYNMVYEFPMERFCRTYHYFPIQVTSALQILTRAGYIEYVEEQEYQARVMFVVERDDLYRLKGNSEKEDLLIVALLRNYSGLFSDYGYIDEALLAQHTGLTMPEVYLLLKQLSQRRVLNFIPQKRTPYVRYMQRREDPEHLLIPPSIYENLKQRFAERVEAMIRYATTDNQCRSRQLLSYFGETESHDCGMCDVCQEHKAEAQQAVIEQQARERILLLLSDGQPHHITELHQLSTDYEQLDSALEHLIREEMVAFEDGFLSACQHTSNPGRTDYEGR